MIAKVISGTHVGLETLPVEVEVDIQASGLPSFTIVGLADRAVEEARERVRSAIKNSGMDFPAKRITVNLAPADLPKVSPVFDLGIALGLMIASGQIASNLDDTLILGELSLDGTLRNTKGVLPMALLTKKLKLKRLFVPKSNAKEAAVVEGIKVYAFSSLNETIKFLLNQIDIKPEPPTKINLESDPNYEYDFSQIKGQEQAKRALEIAAAGGHNVLLKGPPGAGKTLLARSFPSILPPLTRDEALEVTQIYSITGNLPKEKPIIISRPFRSPHHSASYVGIIGGGNTIKPGEISLAHRGVLFLDELPEFPRQVLESLRGPIEDRQIVISRAQGSYTFPAQFILLAAQNPCPCGFLGSSKSCVCNPSQIARYQKKISGPILDRIDIHLDVPAVEIDKLTSLKLAEDSVAIRKRVSKARSMQAKRFKNSNILVNSQMSNAQIREFCKLDPQALELLKKAIAQMNLSARAYHRILKLSRTVADLAENESINIDHVAESLLYRAREEN